MATAPELSRRISPLGKVYFQRQSSLKGTHIQTNTGRTHFKKGIGGRSWRNLKNYKQSSEEIRKKSESLKKAYAEGRRKKMFGNGIPWNKNMKGIHLSTKSEFKNADKRITGANNNNWRGGKTPLNKVIRESPKMKEWRLMVFGRDNYTCQMCKARGCYVEAHHIKTFAKYPELRFEVSNGITLCRPCHDKTKKREEEFEPMLQTIILSRGLIRQ